MMIEDFVAEQRGRFTNDHDNAFAFSWGKVTRRLAFLDLIQARCVTAGTDFVGNTEAVRELTQPGTHPVTPEMARLQRIGGQLSTVVHLEIESFYLFAKIVLDDIARAIEFYFGAANGLALDSHDDLAKRIVRYAEVKRLQVPADFVATIVNLKERISDFRDQKISHEKSPRTMQGSSWGADGRPRIMMTRIFPRETDPRQAESEPLEELRSAINAYIESVIALIRSNESKTNLKLETPDPAPPA